MCSILCSSNLEAGKVLGTLGYIFGYWDIQKLAVFGKSTTLLKQNSALQYCQVEIVRNLFNFVKSSLKLFIGIIFLHSTDCCVPTFLIPPPSCPLELFFANQIVAFCRNCLVGASYHIKISDCAMFRPIYKNDYIRDQDNDHDVLPLRWIPWEVYIMVSNYLFIVYFYTYIYWVNSFKSQEILDSSMLRHKSECSQ